MGFIRIILQPSFHSSACPPSFADCSTAPHYLNRMNLRAINVKILFTAACQRQPRCICSPPPVLPPTSSTVGLPLFQLIHFDLFMKTEAITTCQNPKESSPCTFSTNQLNHLFVLPAPESYQVKKEQSSPIPSNYYNHV
ncbi:hypothetical protein CHARACLAT_008835 [Characodon lateralis]|uniref:Uncharacterized protein n=1 Tax=Characodon lateralis TaxID=208331 RepID=A0ABU7CQP2_9TELE|nr:hypothetical protein [Characodon lateralis]